MEVQRSSLRQIEQHEPNQKDSEEDMYLLHAKSFTKSGDALCEMCCMIGLRSCHVQIERARHAKYSVFQNQDRCSLYTT